MPFQLQITYVTQDGTKAVKFLSLSLSFQTLSTKIPHLFLPRFEYILKYWNLRQTAKKLKKILSQKISFIGEN